MVINSGHLLIVGDSNIHWDCQMNADTKQLADILRSTKSGSMSKKELTHGHILDLDISLVITI